MRCRWNFVAAAVAGLVLIGGPSAAGAAVINVLVGDKDGFGFVPLPCPDVGLCPLLNNPIIDNRSAAEKAATDGAQITDEYSSVFPPAFSPPDSTLTADVIFTFPDTLHGGTISLAVGDFQPDVFGPLSADINGIPVDFAFPDGRFVTAIHSFVLNAAQVAAANAAGQVVLHIDRNGSTDFVAFDWFEAGLQIPEPASLTLLGAALAGFGLIRTRRRTA